MFVGTHGAQHQELAGLQTGQSSVLNIVLYFCVILTCNLYEYKSQYRYVYCIKYIGMFCEN